ncbi:MAG: phosphopyruvate hydratase [Candidatus Diapherotrites archaeon]|nr:phosphopyruvate hydratase [Candidatus Diapherotrites archaeon]
MVNIKKIFARQVLDSRGIPTVEAEVSTDKGVFSAIVPSGTSAGKHEALELRDGGKEYFGKGVSKAVSNVNQLIALRLEGKSFSSQKELDGVLLGLDGTQNKSRLGANAVLSVSMAFSRAMAVEKDLELFGFLGESFGNKEFVLPCPQSVFISGGAHADKSTDFQEFMVMPTGLKSFSSALQCVAEVYHRLAEILKKKDLHTNVGKEGSFAPNLKSLSLAIQGAFAPRLESNSMAFELLSIAVEEAGYSLGKDVSFALDVAASEFFKNGKYVLETEGKTLTGGELVDMYGELLDVFPVVSVEDGFAEDDFESFSEFTKKFGHRVQVVGDDLLVTNVERIKKAVSMNSCNALLLKPNQIGTVSESLEAARLAFDSKWNVVVSHRSGDTEDAFIADLAVAIGCGQIKTGAPARSERTAKYNRLLRIEEKLGGKAVFGKNFFV